MDDLDYIPKEIVLQLFKDLQPKMGDDNMSAKPIIFGTKGELDCNEDLNELFYQSDNEHKDL